MNLCIRMLNEITRPRGRSSLLRLYRQCSFNRHANVSLKMITFEQSCTQNKMFDTKVQGIHSASETCTRETHTGSILSEIPHAQRFFESSAHYVDTIISPKPDMILVNEEQLQQFYNINWENATEQQIIHGLKVLALLEKTDEHQQIFQKMCNVIKTNCNNYQDSTIIELLKGLVHVQQKEFDIDNANRMFGRLDKECLKRFMKSSIPEKLKICYILQYLYLPKFFSFTQVALLKIGYKPHRLTCKQLVQLLYLISVSRKAAINMYELEYRLEQCKEELCITEIGIAVLGFFKTRTTIKSLGLFNYIVQEATQYSSSMDTVTLSSIAKMIRYSMKLQSLLKVSSLLLMLKPRIADVHLMTVTHIAEIYITINFHRTDTLRQIAKRLKDDIKIARIKDIERICLYLAYFNYIEDKEIYDAIINEITVRLHQDNETDAIRFPVSLPRILASLAQIEIYPHALIRHVMDEKYIQQLCNGNYNKLDYCYYYLHYSIQIDDPSYDGPFLNRLALNLQSKSIEFMNSSIMMHKPAKQLSEVTYYCKEVVSVPDAVYVAQFLPHYPIRDILIGLDSNKNPIPIVSALSEIPVWTLKHVHECLPQGTNLIVLVMGSNQVKMRGTADASSLLLSKLRHLKRLGCTPYVIWFEDWNRADTEESRRQLLINTLFSDKATNM